MLPMPGEDRQRKLADPLLQRPKNGGHEKRDYCKSPHFHRRIRCRRCYY